MSTDVRVWKVNKPNASSNSFIFLVKCTLRYLCSEVIKYLHWKAKLRLYVIFLKLQKSSRQQKYADVSNWKTKEVLTIFTIAFRITWTNSFQDSLFLVTYLEFQINTSTTKRSVSIESCVWAKKPPPQSPWKRIKIEKWR